MLGHIGKRSRLLCLALVSAAGFCTSAHAADLQPVSFRLDWLPAGYQAPYYLAQKKGWYEKAGLKVTMTDGNGSATAVQLAGVGQYDVSAAALSNMAIARSKGLPVISIAGFFRKGNIALIVPVDSPIHGPKDLKGKRIYYTTSAQEGPYIDTFLEAGGLKRDEVKLLNVAAAAKFTSYVSGDADGVFTNATALARVNDKRPSRIVLFSDFGINIPDFGLVTSTETLKKKGKVLGKLASVISGAWMYIVNGHQEEAIQALLEIRKNARLNPSIMRQQLKLSMPFLFTKATKDLPVGVQSASDWAAAIATLEKLNLVKPNTKPSDYFTNEYLDVDLIKSIGKSG
jgi:NitT/TauT family transport system substrate-binding protein